MKNYWLVKSEPASYSWDDLVAEGKTSWTGVRNFTARNNLRSMRVGDEVLFYHSVTDKQVVGVARVEKEAYLDPTAKEGEWVCVDLTPGEKLKNPVSLDAIKSDKALEKIRLLKQTRLSVVSLTRAEFERILSLSRSPAQ